MRDDFRLALFSQVRKAVDLVIAASGREQRAHFVTRWSNDGSWHSAWEQRPSYSSGFNALRDKLNEFASPIETAWLAAYPEINDGSHFFGSYAIGISTSPLSRLIGSLTECVLKVNHSPDDVDIYDAIDQFGKERAVGAVRKQFIAFVSGLQVADPAIDRIPLDDQVSIVRIDEALIQRLLDEMYGGAPSVDDTILGHSFALSGECDAPLSNAGQQQDVKRESATPGQLPQRLLNLIRNLNVFKGGCLYIPHVYFLPVRPSVHSRGVFGYGVTSMRWPQGAYTIGPDELNSLSKHMARMSKPTFSELDTACTRLADAELRENPVDSISDAVIGLEALLAGDGEREGLRLKFALNYAAIAKYEECNERARRYREALDLYKIRSGLFHGSDAGVKEYDFGDCKRSLADCAAHSRDMLRETIKFFLALDGIPIKKDRKQAFWKEYWVSRYFGTSPGASQQ